jgi:hypothetical protein
MDFLLARTYIQFEEHFEDVADVWISDRPNIEDLSYQVLMMSNDE